MMFRFEVELTKRDDDRRVLRTIDTYKVAGRDTVGPHGGVVHYILGCEGGDPSVIVYADNPAVVEAEVKALGLPFDARKLTEPGQRR